MRFSVVTLGCKVNRVESDGFTAALRDIGWERGTLADADVVVLNTCTVTGEAEKKTRKALRRCLRENPSAPVIATGCAIAIDPDAYRGIDKRVIAEADKSRVVDCVVELFGDRSLDLDPHASLRVGEGFATRVGIKIQDGCDNACTFCIVHTARGKAQSRDRDEIITEARRYAAAGVKEIVLTGIDIGSYMQDDYSLVDLLRDLLRELDDVRIRISSVEPHTVTDELIEMIAGSDGRICRHLHLPLQAGSDRILSEMDRHYDSATYVTLVDKLYQRIPSLSLTTDIIVGFPSETDDDFAQTADLAKRCRFSKIHVFPYSRRAGTPAAARTDQVNPATIKARADELNRLSAALRADDFEKRIGTTEAVLVEQHGRGTTESYHTIRVPEAAAIGEVLQIILQPQR